MAQTCIFCDRERPDVAEGIIAQSRNFFVKVPFGVVGPGHIMVVPKPHFSCIATMPEELFPEYEKVRKATAEEVSQKLSIPVSQIEYGIWGQTVPHAHEHVWPLKGLGYELRGLIPDMVKPEGISYAKAGWQGIREALAQNSGYVSIQEDGQLYVCNTSGRNQNDSQPGLRYRDFLAERLGVGVKSWAKISDEDKRKDKEMRAVTKAKLSGLAHLISGI